MVKFGLRIRNPKYGWVPDLPDKRDFSYKAIAPVTAEIPGFIDLRANCSPVENQGQLGSCTANALVGNLEYLEKLDFSRLFVYYNERVITHTTNTDSGASLRDGIKTLVKAGDCPETDWPYDIAKFTDTPDDAAYTDALNHQITAYYRLTSIDEMKQTLSSSFPFVFGFSVYESFESQQVAKSGVVPMPSGSESLLGGHAVMAVGYNDEKQIFIVRNSWGGEWGDEGYFYMPYEYLTSPNLSNDFWTIRKMEDNITSNEIKTN